MTTISKAVVIASCTVSAFAGPQKLSPKPTVFSPLIPQPPPPPKAAYSGHPDLKPQPYKSISLRRRASPQGGESYDVTFHWDGTAEFVSTSGFNETGSFAGGVDLFSYSLLCKLIDRMNFRSLKPNYVSGVTCVGTTTISVESNNGIISASEEGNSGPIEFWAIEQAIENLRHESSWWRISPPARKP